MQGWWSIENLTTGVSVLFVKAGTGAEIICLPPGEITDIQINGNNARFRNLARIGSLLDLTTTAVPAWISQCSIPPYLLCNGSSFSAVTYPYLNTLIGANVTPDLRGRVRAMLNQGTARLTSVIADNLFAGGGDQNLQAHLHNVNGVTGAENQAHDHGYAAGLNGVTYAPNAGSASGFNPTANTTGTENQNHNHNLNINSATVGSGNSQNVQPTLMHGITLIRAG